MAFRADHIVSGSHWPVLLAWESYTQTFSWIREVPLPPADIDQILERSAAAVLKLPPGNVC